MNEEFLFFTYLLEKYATYKGKKTKDVLKEWDEKAITKEIYPFAGRKYPLKSKLLSARTGFRYTDNKPFFFCDIGFDLGTILFIFKGGDYEEAKAKAEKETVKDIFDKD